MDNIDRVYFSEEMQKIFNTLVLNGKKPLRGKGTNPKILFYWKWRITPSVTVSLHLKSDLTLTAFYRKLLGDMKDFTSNNPAEIKQKLIEWSIIK